MAIDSQQIKQLRAQTGAGIVDCKKALQETAGDYEKALVLMRKKGAKTALKKQEREAGEGLVGSYLHTNGKVAALVVVNCETDFVARNDVFKQFAQDLAMQVVATNPLYLGPDDIPQVVIDKEKDVASSLLAKEGKPAEMIEKILPGKLERFYQDNCLLQQKFIKDDKLVIKDLIQELTAKLGEKIEVVKFVRYSV